MADERTITTKFEADVSGFTSATQQLSRSTKLLNAEFNNATASLGRWDDNATGLKAKLTQLNGTLANQKSSLDNLKKAQTKLNDQFKNGEITQAQYDRQAEKLEISIQNQEAQIKKTTKQINEYSNSLEDLEKAGVETRQELDKLNKEMDEQEQNAKELGGNLLKGLAVGLAGIATACVGAIAGLSNLVEETKELRTILGQLETSFTQNGLSAQSATDTYNELFGVLGDSGRASEASMHLGQLAKNEQELKEYTDILTGVYATFGQTLPVEGLAEAMNHTANLGSVQGVLADALEWSGINVDDFNKKLEGLNTEEERAELIQQTLNELYGESSAKYKEVNEDVIKANEAQNKYNQTLAKLAEEVQPAITEFKLVMVDVMQAIFNKLSEVDLAGLISAIANAFKGFVNFIIDNADLIISLLAGIGAGLVALNVIKMINGLVVAFKAWKLATEGMTIAQRLLNIAMKANPIGLVATAIGVLVSAIVLLWNKSEGFRNFFTNMWKGIVETVKVAVNGVIGFINVLIKAINKVGEGLNWISGGTLGFHVSEIPYLAKGGIVDKPTLAMVGESGKEAVIPLENNTGWIDQLASKLNAKSTSNSNVVNNFNYTFEKMETSKLALHQAVLETKRALKGFNMELYLINKQGKELNLFDDRYFVMTKADALHGTETDIITSDSPYVDGADVDNVRALPRGIEFEFVLKGEIKDAIDYFMGFVKSKQQITLKQIENNKEISIKGIATIPPYTRMLQTCRISLSVYCGRPYWEDTSFIIGSIASVLDLLNFPQEGQFFTSIGRPFGVIDTSLKKTFKNEGDVAVGMIIQITALGSVVKPRITAMNGNQYGNYLELGLTLNDGDMVEINTTKGNKSIMINGLTERDGEPILNALSFNGVDWLQLETGDNTFLVSAESGNDHVYFTINYKRQFE